MIRLVATIRCPDLTLIGDRSILAIICVSAAITALWLWPRSYSQSRQWLAVMISVSTVFAGYFASEGGFRRYYADQDTAAVIWFAANFGIAIATFRGPSYLASTIGYLLGSAGAFFVGYFASKKLGIIIFEMRPGYMDKRTELFFGFVTLSIWLGGGHFLMRRWRRLFVTRTNAGKGLCPSCCYDLRGSDGQPTCPECGAAIPWDRVILEQPHGS